MKRIFCLLCCVALGLNLVNAVEPQQKSKSPKVYYNAFSHNDYDRSRPLFEAIDLGFNCVEADLWLIDGELYVAHDKPQTLNPERTFEKMYLKPLAERIKANGGKVHKKGKKPFFLMVDCKSNGEEMLPVLKQKMEPYLSLFCTVEKGKMKKGAVLLFLSGDKPYQSILAAGEGSVFLDGRIKDLGKNIDSNMMPVISDDYSSFLKWRGEGEMPQEELEKMRGYIRQAHKEGKLFRWWGAPDTQQFKRLFIEEGVDLIGADKLSVLYEVLTSK